MVGVCVLAAVLSFVAPYVYYITQKKREDEGQKQAKEMMGVRPSGQPRNSYHERQAAEREVRKSAADAAQRASQAYKNSSKKKSSMRSTFVKEDTNTAAVDLADVKADEPGEAV